MDNPLHKRLKSKVGVPALGIEGIERHFWTCASFMFGRNCQVGVASKTVTGLATIVTVSGTIKNNNRARVEFEWRPIQAIEHTVTCMLLRLPVKIGPTPTGSIGTRFREFSVLPSVRDFPANSHPISLALGCKDALFFHRAAKACNLYNLPAPERPAGEEVA